MLRNTVTNLKFRAIILTFDITHKQTKERKVFTEMTLKERLDIALKNYNFDKTANTDAAIAYAYYKGKCKGVEEVCDSARAIFAEQKKRCEESRYHNFAEKIQGNVSMIYHSDYDGWIDTFDNDEIKI